MNFDENEINIKLYLNCVDKSTMKYAIKMQTKLTIHENSGIFLEIILGFFTKGTGSAKYWHLFVFSK